MKEIDIKKNRLDLSYQRNLQLLNIVLLIGAGSFVTYLVALILDFSKLYRYTLVLIVIAFITFILYRNIDNNFKRISKGIAELAK